VDEKAIIDGVSILLYSFLAKHTKRHDGPLVYAIEGLGKATFLFLCN
jgi:hypothetical protein